LAKFSHIDFRHRINRLPMFRANSADLIYCSHAFEYFDRQEAEIVLKEWRRILKKEGVLRLAVPDFEALIKIYKKYKKLQKILGPLFGKWQIEGTKNVIYHKTVYDFSDLKKMLEENGFTKVHKYNWRRTLHKDYDDYSQAFVPHMDKKKGQLLSLNVEAIKK